MRDSATVENAPILLVASGGGHLTQLISLSDRFVPQRPRRWVTFDSDQSRVALAGEHVSMVPYIAPRDWRQLFKTLPTAWRTLRAERPAVVVSTGAAVAMAYLPLARLMGIDAHYIESATRSQEPSLTGKLMQYVPGITLHTQHKTQAVGRWTFNGTVFEGFEAIEGPPRPIQRAVVALGTIKPYSFRRVVERLVTILPPGAEVVWQTGETDISGLSIDARGTIPSEELETAITAADVIVAHAGTGTALTCLQLGKRPLLVPRRAAHGEHVDDHQVETAAYLTDIGVAAVVEAGDLELADLEAAAGWQIRRKSEPVPIPLGPTDRPARGRPRLFERIRRGSDR